ncbi:Dihydrofolate reductase [Frondihabitans sp. 762G35]|uniref:dihydrofolate reductase family protein n=1 Tax=Frondihabitans sp. 762G35 TaxID=1446794 RepID=UPI000D20FFF4|nr:dihydrofolate reductase family protein [Frondihabitans sp. 762G35]ARC56729.1 Dihydrofolate reductase [Frondihabitans sp. 762G35]
MRTLVALVFNYSLNGLLADEGTDFYRFCFELLDRHGGPDHDDASLDFLRTADAHLMGRSAYEGMAANLPQATDHPWSAIMNAAPKIVFSTTLDRADWENTMIVSGGTSEEVERIRDGGDGHVVVWGGVRLWRSLMRLDLIDEFAIGLHPYVTNEGTVLFDDVPDDYRLLRVSSDATGPGVLELRYRRDRGPSATR